LATAGNVLECLKLAAGGARTRFRFIGWWVGALAILGAAFALRCHALGWPNLTNDEWFMLRNHDEGALWIIHQAHTFEPHPLLYYLGLAGWIELAGRSEFAMRFLSVGGDLLLVAAAIGMAREVAGWRAGLVVGALAALNPYQIAEAQNARNYALVVGLAAVASLLFLRALDRNRRRDWLAYGAAMLLALNTHLDAALVLAAHVAFVLIRLALARLNRHPIDRRFLRSWLATSLAVGIVFGAWLVYALPALMAYHGYFPSPVTIDVVLLRSLATFGLGPGAAIRDAVPLFALALVGLGWLVIRRPDRALLLALSIGLPIGLVGLLFLKRPMFDERYLIVLAPAYLVLIGCGISALWERLWPVGLVATIGVLALTARTLPDTYQSQLTDRPDFRAMAAWIDAFGSPSDPIVATGHGQAELFSYYYSGPRPIQVLDDPATIPRDVPARLSGHAGLWLLPSAQSPADVAATDTLSRVAIPSAEKWFVNARALYYLSADTVQPAAGGSATWDDGLRLESAQISAGPSEPGTAAGVVLDWRIAQAVASPKISLRLFGETGNEIAQSDVPLGLAAERLTAGALTTRVGLLVPPATPPGDYRIAIFLYQPDGAPGPHLISGPTGPTGELVLGSVRILPRVRSVSAFQTGIPLTLPTSWGGVSLLGHDPLGPPGPAGGWLDFQVLWRADRTGLPDLTRTIELVGSNGKSVGTKTEPILATFPTSHWTAGELLAEPIRWQIPPTVGIGDYQLQVRAADGNAAPLGTVEVNGPVRSYQPLSAQEPIGARFGAFGQLVGRDLDVSAAKPGGSVHLRLVWQARGTADKSYKVFVHVLDATGKIQGQVDRLPLNGSRPTDSWVTGEYLADDYDVPLPADRAGGRYTIEIGLYDAATGARVPVTRADGGSDDHLVVGTWSMPS
jgi:Dolichyl-phosphate-mannose-protein mannosyltransferase